MFWNVLECSGMSWNVLECSGMFWNVLECSGMFWNVLECSGMYEWVGMHPITDNDNRGFITNIHVQ